MGDIIKVFTRCDGLSLPCYIREVYLALNIPFHYIGDMKDQMGVYLLDEDGASRKWVAMEVSDMRGYEGFGAVYRERELRFLNNQLRRAGLFRVCAHAG